MYRRVQRKLREIDYHAARRPRNAWSRAADASLAAAFVLAFPLTWYSNLSIERPRPIHTVTGIVQKTGQSKWVAHVADPDADATDYGVPAEELHAYFSVEVQRLDRGFPIVTSTVTRQPTVAVRRLADDSKAWADADPDSRVRRAIEEAVVASNLPDARAIASRWAAGGTGEDHDILSWVAASFVWGIASFVVLSLGVITARLATIVLFRTRSAREAALMAQGRCPSCGYDLRGLEFSERCPECGEMQE